MLRFHNDMPTKGGSRPKLAEMRRQQSTTMGLVDVYSLPFCKGIVAPWSRINES